MASWEDDPEIGSTQGDTPQDAIEDMIERIDYYLGAEAE